MLQRVNVNQFPKVSQSPPDIDGDVAVYMDCILSGDGTLLQGLALPYGMRIGFGRYFCYFADKNACI